LQPDLPEGHLALGFSYYYGDRDYERALAEFEIAKRDLPNEAKPIWPSAPSAGRQGKWADQREFGKSCPLRTKEITSSDFFVSVRQLFPNSRLIPPTCPDAAEWRRWPYRLGLRSQVTLRDLKLARARS